MTPATDPDALLEHVRARYAAAANGECSRSDADTCCGATVITEEQSALFGQSLYGKDERDALPDSAVLASLGCGNPLAIAELHEGESVLDLGSGGGIDVLLSARRVGPSGIAYGLDMTDEMLELANENKAKAGATNVEFLRGTIEDIPLPSKTADVIISNCVINLSGDKDQVLREAFRVLKPGGRLAVSDIVIRRELPEPVRKSMELWTGCVAGALHEQEYVEKLRAAGFTDIHVEPTRVYTKEDAAEMASSACCGDDVTAALSTLDGAVMSAFVRATRPRAS
jgi:arsenite methyltransferase